MSSQKPSKTEIDIDGHWREIRGGDVYNASGQVDSITVDGREYDDADAEIGSAQVLEKSDQKSPQNPNGLVRSSDQPPPSELDTFG